MSDFEVGSLRRENARLLSQLRAVEGDKARLEGTSPQSERIATLEGVLKSQHGHRKQLEAKLEAVARTHSQQASEHEQVSEHCASVLEKLEGELKEAQAKYHRLESKVLPLLDHDTVRLQVLNEVEGVHAVELERWREKVQALEAEKARLKVEKDSWRAKAEQYKACMEETKRGQMLRKETQERSAIQQTLLAQELERRQKESFEEARKEAEYYKAKYFQLQKKLMAPA